MWPGGHNRFSPLDMTAISLNYTDMGFALAADGFSRWGDQATLTDEIRKHEKNDERKIFKTTYGGADIGYAITGSVFNQDKTFSLIAETSKTMKSLSYRRFGSVEQFIELVAARLKDRITAAKNRGILTPFEDNPNCDDPIEKATFARLFLAGYFKSIKPFLAVVRMFHKDQRLADPEQSIEIPPKTNIYSGSREIAAIIFEHRDPRFAKYYLESLTLKSPIEEAVACARTYVEACSDSLASEIDPICKGIGGKIHIATITPTEGFQWVPGFEHSDPDRT
jgi:hypothetical protein